MNLYIDIETAPESADFSTYRKAGVWESRYCKDKPDTTTAYDWYYERAGLFPEFSKIVCISLWYVSGDWQWIKWSIAGHDEPTIITKFFERIWDKKWLNIIWHNILSYDIPFIWKRAIINWLSPHTLIDTTGKKPRDIKHIHDTMNIWKQTAWSSTWLETIAICLDIENPKNEISGKDVWALYWSDDPDRVKKIKEYCERDTYTTYLIHSKITSLLPK